MAGLFGDLISASKSLATQSQALQITGKNIANVNNEAYARQRLIISDRGVVKTPIGVQSMGAEGIGIRQYRDKYLDAQLARETSTTNYLAALASQLGQAEANLGEQLGSSVNSASLADPVNATTGISSALNAFFNAAEGVAAKPSDSGARQILLQQAALLASKFNTTDARLQTTQSNITDQVSGAMGTVNDLLSEIANLNAQIQKIEVSAAGSAVDMRDQRQAKLEELSQLIDFSYSEVPGQFGQIELNVRATDGTNVKLIDRGVASSISFDGTNFQGGTPPVALAFQGGSLQGAIDARDGSIQDLRDNIATIANQVIAAVNDAYNPGGSSTNFFTAGPPGLMQVASGLTVATLRTSSSGYSGDNSIISAVADVANHRFSTTGGDLIDGTLSGFYTESVTGFAQDVATAEARLSDQEIVSSLILGLRSSVSGVALDEELANLMQFQRGYQASARLITVIDSLLDTLINGTGLTR